MRKKMVLATFILILSFGSVWADIPPLPREKPPVQKPPVTKPAPPHVPISPKEEQKQGICFSPLVVGGLFLSLSLIAFGLRFLRGREILTETAEAVS